MYQKKHYNIGDASHKVNLRTLQVVIGTVQHANSTKSGKILGQYKVNHACQGEHNQYFEMIPKS